MELDFEACVAVAAVAFLYLDLRPAAMGVGDLRIVVIVVEPDLIVWCAVKVFGSALKQLQSPYRASCLCEVFEGVHDIVDLGLGECCHEDLRSLRPT